MTIDIRVGDCLDVLRTLDAGTVQCCVTSPPYFGLRDYGHAGQIGLEATPDDFVAKLVAVFAEVRRVLADDGTLWLNLGDSYAGSWGAQSREGAVAQRSGTGVDRLEAVPEVEQGPKALRGGSIPLCSTISAGQIAAHPKRTHTGSLANMPGLKPKDMIGIPWRVAFALQADGWYLRSDIIWSKKNCMPESVADRPTKSHEYLFLLAKSERYYYDADAIKEPVSDVTLADRPNDGRRIERSYPGQANRGNGRLGEGETRNKRTVWTVASSPYLGAHFATFPPALIEPCILAGSRVGDTILDPFGGAGTTGLVADRLSRHALLIELNPAYAELARERIRNDNPLFVDIA